MTNYFTVFFQDDGLDSLWEYVSDIRPLIFSVVSSALQAFCFIFLAERGREYEEHSLTNDQNILIAE